MARLVFPNDRTVQRSGSAGGLVRNAIGATATVYRDSAGSQLADIQDISGVAVPASTLAVDSNSMLPLFNGPDGVDTVYVMVDGGPIVPVYARSDDRLDSLESAVVAASSNVADLYGYLAVAYDPVSAVNTSQPVAGTLHVTKVRLRKAAIVTNVILHVATAGATLTAGQSWAGLWDAAGTRLDLTAANQAASWLSVGTKIMALGGTSPTTVRAAGDYYVGFWANGTTMPAFASRSGSPVVNLDLAAVNLRFATADTGLTTTAPAAMAAKVASSNATWAALS